MKLAAVHGLDFYRPGPQPRRVYFYAWPQAIYKLRHYEGTMYLIHTVQGLAQQKPTSQCIGWSAWENCHFTFANFLLKYLSALIYRAFFIFFTILSIANKLYFGSIYIHFQPSQLADILVMGHENTPMIFKVKFWTPCHNSTSLYF